VSDEFANLSEPELLSLIETSERELELRKSATKDKFKQEIEDRLKSAGRNVGELSPDVTGKRGVRLLTPSKESQ
jgi:hypothetical protein